MFTNFSGVNFLGKLHNTKQHIQFIKWIKDEIEIPQIILNSFLTSYSNLDAIESKDLIPAKKQNIKDAFDSCDFYIFEICSLKLYEKDGYQVQNELTNNYISKIQSSDDLYHDLEILYSLIPKGKKVIFQCHFRPNIIYNNSSKMVINREIIYNRLNDFCMRNSNTYIYDPSTILKVNKSLFNGDMHFNSDGHIKSFEYIFTKYIR